MCLFRIEGPCIQERSASAYCSPISDGSEIDFMRSRDSRACYGTRDSPAILAEKRCLPPRVSLRCSSWGAAEADRTACRKRTARLASVAITEDTVQLDRFKTRGR
jgi:hypothetical protein